ncbi:MAG: cytochrome c oxidase subunit II [Phormidesmis sp.]
MSTSNRTTNLSRVFNRRRIINLLLLFTVNCLISFWMGQQAYTWMPPQASAEAILVDKLFSFMTAIGTFIFIGVSGTLLYSTIFQRAAKYDDRDGPPIEGNVTLEIVWTAIPILLIIWIGTVSFKTYDRMSILGAIAPEQPTNQIETVQTIPLEPTKTVSTNSVTPTQPIEVLSRQWAWEFRYPNDNVSSTELHLPVNQRARFKLTSEDVLHGFYVPAFRVKQDIVPGKTIDFSFTPIRKGRYRLRDSEYSGTYFAANQTNVVVESTADYEKWLAIAAKTQSSPAENVSIAEFSKAAKRAEKGTISLGWATVKPAPAPTVNYTASEKDTYE